MDGMSDVISYKGNPSLFIYLIQTTCPRPFPTTEPSLIPPSCYTLTDSPPPFLISPISIAHLFIHTLLPRPLLLTAPVFLYSPVFGFNYLNHFHVLNRCPPSNLSPSPVHTHLNLPITNHKHGRLISRHQANLLLTPRIQFIQTTNDMRQI